MSVDVRESLERLRNETDANTLAEVVRNALAVYDFAWNVQKKGGFLQAIDKAGNKRDLVMMFPGAT